MLKQNSNQTPKESATFALLIDSIAQDYQVELMAGAMDAAREHDVNLICYIAGAPGVDRTRQFDMLYGFVKKLIDPALCDGILLSNTFAGFTSRASSSDFLMRYHAGPMVGIVTIDPRVPHISADNLQAMRAVLTHLIEQHNYRRIAIIRGPLHQHEADERFQAYCDVLAEYGLPLDPELVLLGILHTHIRG